MDFPVGVVWQDIKQATLYCDKIMPCAGYDEVPAEFRIDFETLKPTYRQLASEYVPNIGESEWEAFVRSIHTPDYEYDDETSWTADDTVYAAARALSLRGVDCFTFTSRSHRWAEDDRLLQYSYYEERREWYESHGRQNGELEPPRYPSIKTNNMVEVQLHRMNVVNTELAPWEQVYDFKKDNESVRALRDMRLLFDEKLRDKNFSFVEDYISKKLDDYELARKKHGFETATGTLQLFLNSKSAAGAGAIAAAGIIADKSAISVPAFSAAVVLELGNVIVNIINRRKSFTFFGKNADLAYVFMARGQLRS
ncbi:MULTISPECIES: hypothetical protein [Actinosynnema]|uniref:hypothetical protein n=1 Tax=Actinosynnema TaxID=40566 RepID=UPI0020A4C7F1|nr:hypothetical protein [Actinosynnema pretiosum]